MDPKDAAARHWASEWREAWSNHDAERVARLYADDAVLQLHPLRDAYHGPEGARQYAEWAFTSEDTTPDVRFGEPVISANRAICEYWAVVHNQGGEETIAGVSLLEFGADGLVVSQRDYWHSQPGRSEPPSGWGR